MAKDKEQEPPKDLAKVTGFFRRHPVLAVLGTAGAGLIGGIELAFGVVLGAGVAALVGKPGAARAAATEVKEETAQAGERLAKLTPEVQKRARAILQAARGRLAPA
jgi:hypothetical protein